MVVSMANWAPCHKDRPAATDLQPASIKRVEGCKVYVAHEHVRGDQSACLSANLRCGALERKPSLPLHPCLRARCVMVAKYVTAGGHIGKCSETRGGAGATCG